MSLREALDPNPLTVYCESLTYRPYSKVQKFFGISLLREEERSDGTQAIEDDRLSLDNGTRL